MRRQQEGEMTAQIHELLILNGDRTSMAFCPPLPRVHPRIVETDSNDIERSEANDVLFSTACWRQYQGTWEIKDGRFYLVHLQGIYKLVGDEPILADWFTGVLRIPRGEEIVYVHMGFGTVYEEELLIEIVRGAVVDARIMDNREKRWDADELALLNLPGSEEFCGYCGTYGDHPECRKKKERYWAKRRLLLRQFAIDGTFGPVSSDPEMTLEEAVSRLKEHLGYDPEFDISSVIENRNWWFIPHGWIGMLGFVVDKHTGQITELGSGWGADWEALKAYEAGLIDPEPPKQQGR